MAGQTSRDEYTYMSMRQRIDFAIITVTFGVLVGVFVSFIVSETKSMADYLTAFSINAFTILSAQHFVRDYEVLYSLTCLISSSGTIRLLRHRIGSNGRSPAPRRPDSCSDHVPHLRPGIDPPPRALMQSPLSRPRSVLDSADLGKCVHPSPLSVAETDEREIVIADRP